MTSDKTFGWLFIGSGSITRRVLKDFPTTAHNYLAAVFSKTFANAQKLVGEFGGVAYNSLEEAFKDKNVKAVYVATPHPFHKEFVIAAINHRLPVLVEKPITMNINDTNEIISLASTSNVYLVDGLWHFHNPVIKLVLSTLQGGAIGSVLTTSVSFCFNAPYDINSRLYAPSLGGGGVLDVGIYAISFAYYVFGQKKPTEIQATATYAPSGTDSTAAITLKFDNEGIARLFCAVSLDEPQDAMIVGTKGSIFVPKFWQPKNAIVRIGGEEKSLTSDHIGEGYNFEFDAAAADILAGRTQNAVVTHKATVEIFEIVDYVLKIISSKK